MSELAETLVLTLVTLIAAMLGLWLVASRRRDVSVVDIFWGCGFAVVAWLACWWNAATEPRPILLAVLTSVWGLRLSVHLARRNWGRPEDRRYAAMRQRHGDAFPWISLWTVFFLQAILLWFVSMPLQVAAAESAPNNWNTLDAVGIALWTLGFLFESVGDWQLARFKSQPENAGRVMDRGLWRFTRHPNYFGDFCVWWGLYLVAAAGGAAWTVASPILMSVLLLRVSGVTLLESTIVERRPEYAAYQARTNAFFPGPPRR
jgi:steroid 5-alpha reductase family enzyme